jgi:hypothetical protein
MSPETWWHIGNWTLYGLIGFGAAAMLTYGFRKKWFWVAAIGGCFASVIASEIVSFIFFHKSISTQYGEWIQAEPFWAALGLIFFSLSMICLVLHLVAYGFKRKPQK